MKSLWKHPARGNDLAGHRHLESSSAGKIVECAKMPVSGLGNVKPMPLCEEFSGKMPATDRPTLSTGGVCACLN